MGKKWSYITMWFEARGDHMDRSVNRARCKCSSVRDSLGKEFCEDLKGVETK